MLKNSNLKEEIPWNPREWERVIKCNKQRHGKWRKRQPLVLKRHELLVIQEGAPCQCRVYHTENHLTFEND